MKPNFSSFILNQSSSNMFRSFGKNSGYNKLEDNSEYEREEEQRRERERQRLEEAKKEKEAEEARKKEQEENEKWLKQKLGL